nr:MULTISPECIES: peptide ABC transporter substrate-binding protein [Myxococcaceae]
MRPFLLSLTLGLALPAHAAGRPPYGGTLALAHAGALPPADPALADTPEQATLRALGASAMCRLPTAQGAVQPVLALKLERTRPQLLEVTLPSPALASAFARALSRLSGSEAPSPYRALLQPLQGEGRKLSATGATLPLALAYPWPDLERALCHPALGAPEAPGPFTQAPAGAWTAQPRQPEGRPFLDAVVPTRAEERELARRLGTGEAQVALGGPGPEGAPGGGAALYATYLAFSPRRVPADFRQAVESVLDRVDLTRLYVRGPAEPMAGLLPPALAAALPGAAPAAPRPAPPASAGGRRVTLLYDAQLADQRAVAERLQVKLYERGYAVALQALPRAALRARWAAGDYELMLHAVLLPPVPSLALAVALDTGGRHDLLGVELPRLGAVADQAARDARARERALALAPSVPLVPLYAQGLALRARPELQGLAWDAQGLALLAGAWLQPAGAP